MKPLAKRPSSGRRAPARAVAAFLRLGWRRLGHGAASCARNCNALPWPSPLSALREHVSGVRLRRAHEQVIDANAPRVVAAVADEQPFIDSAVRQLVGRPRRVNGSSVEPELAVAVSVHSASPQPAVTALVDVRVEPRDGVGALGFVRTTLRAEAADLRDRVGDRSPALLALARHGLRASANAAGRVAGVTTELRDFTGAAHRHRSATVASAFNSRRVMPWHVTSRVTQEAHCA